MSDMGLYVQSFNHSDFTSLGFTFSGDVLGFDHDIEQVQVEGTRKRCQTCVIELVSGVLAWLPIGMTSEDVIFSFAIKCLTSLTPP